MSYVKVSDILKPASVCKDQVTNTRLHSLDHSNKIITASVHVLDIFLTKTQDSGCLNCYDRAFLSWYTDYSLSDEIFFLTILQIPVL